MHRVRIFQVMLFLALITILHPPSTAQAIQELVQNGGFETGNFAGWSHSNSLVTTTYPEGTYDALDHPPHAGTYSAEVGSATSAGSISQTVEIPRDSNAKFTAWYRLEQRSSLSLSLKVADGAIIKQWSLSAGPTATWNELTYTIDARYAGQSLTIEADATGYEESVAIACYDPSGFEYVCGYSYNDYFAFVDDISMVPTVVAFTSTVSLTGLPSALSSTLYIDGQPQENKIRSAGVNLTFPLNSQHTISVDQYVIEDNTTRYFCAQSSISASSDGSVTFTYITQYYLRACPVFDLCVLFSG